MGQDCFFRNVYAFVDRVKDVAAYRGEEQVKARLPALLRGSAQLWYTSSLDSLAKNGLRHTPGLEQWFKVLEEQFRQPLQQSLSALSTTRYTYQDAIKRRPFLRYVAEMQLHARNAGFTDKTMQLTYAYSGMDTGLKKTMPEPTKDMSAQDFIRFADSQKQDWVDIANQWTGGMPRSSRNDRFDRNDDNNRFNQNDRFDRNDRSQSRRDRRARFQNSNRDYSRGNSYPKQQGYKKSTVEEHVLQGDKKTYGDKPSSGQQSKPLRPFLQGGKPMLTHAVDEDSGQGTSQSEDEDEQAEESYHAHNKIDDSGDDDDGVEINHVDSPSLATCSVCHKDYDSNNRLHAHIRREHSKTTEKKHAKW